jgi:putative lipoic acid-binding regulatory protein
MLTEKPAEGSLLSFPCDFPIKVMGKAADDFDALVVSLVRRHFPDLMEGAVRTRLSRQGRFMSITVTVRAESRAQLDATYLELTANERVLMAL